MRELEASYFYGASRVHANVQMVDGQWEVERDRPGQEFEQAIPKKLLAFIDADAAWSLNTAKI